MVNESAVRRILSKLLPLRERFALQPVGSSVEHYEDALLDMLAASPNVLLTVFLLAGIAIYSAHDDLHPVALFGWAAATLVIGFTRQGLIWMFRAQTEEARAAHKRKWLLFARMGPTAYSLAYGAYAALAFPYIDLVDRLAISLVGAGMLVGAVGFSALAGRAMLYITLGCSAWGWYMAGGEMSAYAVLICAVGLLMYPPARGRQAALNVERIRLIHQASSLSETLAKINADLERVNQDKSFLLATASHDLRQPVHALALLTEGLALDGATAEDRQKLQKIQSSIGLMGDMLRSLMDVSQLDGGLYVLQKSSFSIGQTIEEICANGSSIARQKGLKMSLDVSGAGGILVYTDRGLLGRMIFNLIGNAIKYTAKGGITVSAHLNPDGAVLISIEDTGIGIRPEDRVDIFRAYVRLGTADQKMSNAGLGIGLAIVDLGVKLLGLPLSLESKPGHGSRFDLVIPPALVRKNSNALESKGSPSVQDRVKGHERVLILEDDGVIVRALSDLLARWGYTVREARSTAEAMHILNSGYNPDLLISDYSLDENESGLEFIGKMRRHLADPQRPALLITGHVRIMDQPSMGLGATLVLYKPVRPPVLRAAIQEALASRAGLG